MINNTQHLTVLLKETIDLLNIQKDHWYIDATAGGGGHSLEIINRGGNIILLDRDQTALDRIRELFHKQQIPTEKYQSIHQSFGNLNQVNEILDYRTISGIVFDLGLSSDQLDDGQRGFSFLKEGPLDMRMDQTQDLTAEIIINTYSEQDLSQMFRLWGDEPKSLQIAKAIVTRRIIEPFNTTVELAEFIKKKFPSPGIRIHPATKIFQAIRITVNREPEQLAHGLFYAWELLKSQGRIAVISFHSGEDRMVKNFINEHLDQGSNLTRKPITPSTEEIAVNPRSRSAKLRAIQKI